MIYNDNSKIEANLTDIGVKRYNDYWNEFAYHIEENWPNIETDFHKNEKYPFIWEGELWQLLQCFGGCSGNQNFFETVEFMKNVVASPAEPQPKYPPSCNDCIMYGDPDYIGCRECPNYSSTTTTIKEPTSPPSTDDEIKALKWRIEALESKSFKACTLCLKETEDTIKASDVFRDLEQKIEALEALHKPEDITRSKAAFNEVKTKVEALEAQLNELKKHMKQIVRNQSGFEDVEAQLAQLAKQQKHDDYDFKRVMKELEQLRCCGNCLHIEPNYTCGHEETDLNLPSPQFCEKWQSREGM